AMRAGIESTLSQGVRAFDLRRSRSIGPAKTHLQHMFIAVGINLKRVMAWVTHPPPTKPYISPLSALVSSGSGVRQQSLCCYWADLTAEGVHAGRADPLQQQHAQAVTHLRQG